MGSMSRIDEKLILNMASQSLGRGSSRRTAQPDRTSGRGPPAFSVSRSEPNLLGRTMVSSPALSLLKRIICPHCWKQFAPEDILWISTHPDLNGDARLGPEKPRRFLPSRFTVGGDALDARGHPCPASRVPRSASRSHFGPCERCESVQ